MKDRLTDGELRDIERRYLRDGVCPLSPESVWLMAYELISRRAKEAGSVASAYDAGFIAADTKPSPIEQGTLRDEFAGQAMAAVVSGCTWPNRDNDNRWPELASGIAELAYIIADAMLAQRAKETEKP